MAKSRKAYFRQYDAKRADKRAGTRTRNWRIIFYPEDLPEDWTSQVDGLGVKWIEGPLHDQDLNDGGEPKKPHRHTLFMFDGVKTVEQVEAMLKGIFGESETGLIIGVAEPQKALDRGATVRYMAHMDNPDKVRYDESEIVGHNGADVSEILRRSATETRELIIAMEEYIENNGIIELSAFSRAIRYDYPEWHTILATKMTLYFSMFIRSRRHEAKQGVKVVRVDINGEVLEDYDE